jgi:hypothetical protein
MPGPGRPGLCILSIDACHTLRLLMQSATNAVNATWPTNPKAPPAAHRLPCSFAQGSEALKSGREPALAAFELQGQRRNFDLLAHHPFTPVGGRWLKWWEKDLAFRLGKGYRQAGDHLARAARKDVCANIRRTIVFANFLALQKPASARENEAPESPIRIGETAFGLCARHV